MPGGFEDYEAASAAMAARDLGHREEMGKVKWERREMVWISVQQQYQQYQQQQYQQYQQQQQQQQQ